MAKPVPRTERTRKPTRKTAGGPSVRGAGERDAEPRGEPIRREGLIDRIDRVASRPFMKGDYMPGEIRGRGNPSDDCDTGRRRGGR
jgi:RecB family exonuclease